MEAQWETLSPHNKVTGLSPGCLSLYVLPVLHLSVSFKLAELCHDLKEITDTVLMEMLCACIQPTKRNRAVQVQC